jgi:hypothetical protein
VQNARLAAGEARQRRRSRRMIRLRRIAKRTEREKFSLLGLSRDCCNSTVQVFHHAGM